MEHQVQEEAKLLEKDCETFGEFQFEIATDDKHAIPCMSSVCIHSNSKGRS